MMTISQSGLNFNPIISIAIFIVGTGIVILCQILLLRLIKSYVTRMDKPPLDVINGINILTKFISMIAILYLFILAFNASIENIIIVSAILGSIISFGSAQAIQNFIAGLYIVFTAPFGIMDFISLDGKEGFVQEISLNYTKIKTIDNTYHFIPNKKILSTNIINYNNKIDKKDKNSEFLSFDNLQKLFSTEIINYSFLWGVPLGDYDSIVNKIEKVCVKYESTFGNQPEFFLFNVSHRLQFKFMVKVDNKESERLENNLTDFRDELALQFH